jgi:hypothetical protein
MTIEVFYFGGCPSYKPTVERIRTLLREERIDGDIRQVEVTDLLSARDRRFLGSPTVQVNGLDIERSARTDERYGLCCRTYSGSGVPSVAMIRSALRDARGVECDG